MNIRFDSYSLADLQEAAEILAHYFKGARHFALYGSMGAGKTTFIQHICAELGVMDAVQSPTYALVNEYRTHKGQTVYHFDCFRINNLADAEEAGLADYFYSDAICLIEWPEKIQPLLPERMVNIYIEPEANRRVLRMQWSKAKTIA